MKLDDLTWPDVDSLLAKDTPVLIPFGSLEQHGPHLPFDTDTICAQAVADGAAEIANALSLPALSYGAPSRTRSGGGPVFPLGAEIPLGTYFDVVRGIMLNLLQRGVRNLVAVGWHTENGVVFMDAAREAVSLAGTDAKVVCIDSPGNFISAQAAAQAFVDGPVKGEFEHAGLIETSVMLALAADRVRTPFADVEARLPSLPYDVVPQPAGVVSPTGSFTSPKSATAEIGQLLLDDVLPGLAAAVETEFSTRR
jgi:creatinine amidohydrolase